jgi:pimeloyl-ACP methyl ester carboxylesterase
MEPQIFQSRGLDLAASVWRSQSETPSATIILCHDAFGTKEHWGAFGPSLAAAGYLTLALDMEGHGESQGPRGHVHVKKWAEDILSVADQVESKSLVLFGLGSGGSAALVAASQDPRVKALVLLSPRVRPWQMPFVTALFWQSLRIMGLLNRLVTRKDLRISLVGVFGSLALVKDQDTDEELRNDPQFLEAINNIPVPGSWDSWFFNGLGPARRLRAPSLILHGQHDQINSISNSQAFHQELSSPSEMITLEESGHIIPLDGEREAALQQTLSWLEPHLPNG